jgi:hypothetical protein
MEGQRQRATRGRRRRKARAKTSPANGSEPILIVARRPDSPRVRTPSKSIAASAKPRQNRVSSPAEATLEAVPAGDRETRPRRAARIIEANLSTGDFEATRARLLRRLLEADGRSAITKAADALRDEQIEVPEEQEFHVQLLDHNNEARARDAISVLSRLLERQPPKKRPIMERRLRRLEQEADEVETRTSAALLLKTMRAA